MHKAHPTESAVRFHSLGGFIYIQLAAGVIARL